MKYKKLDLETVEGYIKNSEFKPVIDYICLWLSFVKNKSILQFDELNNFDQIYSNKNGFEGSIYFIPSVFCLLEGSPIIANEFIYQSSVNNTCFEKYNLKNFHTINNFNTNYTNTLDYLNDDQSMFDFKNAINKLLSFKRGESTMWDVMFNIISVPKEFPVYYKINNYKCSIEKMFGAPLRRKYLFQLHANYRRAILEGDSLNFGGLGDYIDNCFIDNESI